MISRATILLTHIRDFVTPLMTRVVLGLLKEEFIESKRQGQIRVIKRPVLFSDLDAPN